MGSALGSLPRDYKYYILKINLLHQVWRPVLLVPAVGRLRQENNLKANLRYMGSLRPAWAT